MLKGPSAKVAALAAALTAGAALALAQLADTGPVGQLDIPAWGIAIGILAAETLAIHLPTRNGAHTVSLSEVPLALGLVALAPPTLVAAVMIPTGIVLFLRRQTPIKTAFNLANFAAGTTLAATVVHTWGSSSDPRLLWTVVLAALAIQAFFTSAMVATAIILTDRQRTIQDTVVEIVTSTSWNLFAAYLGTMLVAAWMVESLIAYMLVGLIGGAVVASRVYGRLHRRHVELESLYAITRAVEPARNLNELVGTFLVEVADRLRVRHLWIAYGDSQVGWRSVHHEAEGADKPSESSDPQLEELAHQLAIAAPSELRRLLPEQLRSASGDAIVSPIHIGGDLFGVVVAMERTGPDALADSDREFLRTIVGHLGSLLGRSLAQAHLLVENEDKKRIIRSKDQLIAAVSHELRTPLTGIVGFAEILRDSEAFEDLASCEMVEIIAEQSTDLAHIVDDLLTASRVELDALVVDRAPTEIDELVRSTVASLTVKEDRAFEQYLEPAVASVDRHRLRQVVRNLLTNAFRYGGYGVRVAVRATSTGAIIDVSDDGEGIGDTDPETIFQPYGSVHPQSPSQPGSVGLGLTISRQLIRKMGGDITYHRADGWTTFRVSLARTIEPATQRAGAEHDRHHAPRPKLAAPHDSRAGSPG
jgi:signal transduction histidine kinase